MESRIIILQLISLTLFGCGSSPESKDVSHVNLVNGVLATSDQYQSVIQVAVELGGGARASCTASIVSKTTLLTAAHCLVDDSGNPAGHAIAVFPDREVSGGRIVLHPGYSDRTLANDVAVAVFPANTFEHNETMPVGKLTPTIGERISIVGFGKSDHFDPASGGKKRFGFNVITAVTERISFIGQLRTTDASGSNVLNSQGDSGGPMMNGDGHIIGVSSSLTSPAPNDQVSTGHYTNLVAPVVRDFLNSNGL